jgi:hypothetical protein
VTWIDGESLELPENWSRLRSLMRAQDMGHKGDRDLKGRSQGLGIAEELMSN